MKAIIEKQVTVLNEEVAKLQGRQLKSLLLFMPDGRILECPELTPSYAEKFREQAVNWLHAWAESIASDYAGKTVKIEREAT